MNLSRVLLAPWIATPRSLRWIVALGLGVCFVADGLGRIFGHADREWLWSAAMLGIGNGICWGLLMPNAVLLVRDAQQLRLPGIRRDVAWSLPLYAVLSLGVPVLLQLPDGHVASFAVVLVLAAASGGLYMLLPGRLALLAYVLLVLNGTVFHVFRLPGLTDPRFVRWGAAAAPLLVLAVVWRWRQLLRAGDIPLRRLRAPNVINMRRAYGMSRADPLTDAALLRARPDWLAIRPDLRDTGPQATITSLRMALGGQYVPQTLSGRLYQLVPSALIMLVGLIFLATSFGDHRVWPAMRYLFGREGFVYVGWLFAVVSMMSVMTAVEVVTLRWGRLNAELPLLVLLPGLGHAGDIKRMLLRAVLQRPARFLGAIGMDAASLGVGWPVVLTMLLIVAGCLGYLVAMALGILGGHALSGAGKLFVLIGMLVLLSLTALLPMLWHGWSGLTVVDASAALAASWLVLALFLLWLGHRGWRGLQARPHPFLANE